jgi:hypothetical protein
MKTTMTNKWMNSLLIVIAAMSVMACGKDKKSAAASVANPYGYGTGIGPNCQGCQNFGAGGPILFQGQAVAPPPGNSVFQIVGAQVSADAQGYQMAAQSGLRPLVNGVYPAAVGGMFRLMQPITCGGMSYPPGDYNIQMLQMGQNQNGIFHAPAVALVSTTTGATIQPASVAMIFVDANLDNVADQGSLFKVGFCGGWLDMNTI